MGSVRSRAGRNGQQRWTALYRDDMGHQLSAGTFPSRAEAEAALPPGRKRRPAYRPAPRFRVSKADAERRFAHNVAVLDGVHKVSECGHCLMQGPLS